jgi:hypothetical protein
MPPHKNVLTVDFGTIPMESDDLLPLLWSGLIFKATMPLPSSDNEDKMRFVKKQSLLAFGGRFDNLVAHYQLEIAKYTP